MKLWNLQKKKKKEEVVDRLSTFERLIYQNLFAVLWNVSTNNANKVDEPNAWYLKEIRGKGSESSQIPARSIKPSSTVRFRIGRKKCEAGR